MRACFLAGILALSSAVFTLPASGADTNLPYDPANLVEFKDKLQLFALRLPAGYVVQDNSTADRTKVTLRYGEHCQVILLSSIMRKPWDAPSEMETKMRALRSGQVVGMASNITSKLRRLDVADGYEYAVLKSDLHCLHGFAGVARGRSFVYVVEVTGRPDSAAMARQLAEMIDGSFKVLVPPLPTPRGGAKSAPPGPRAAAHDDWSGAEAAIKVDGVIRNQQQVLAMISGQMVATGETVRIVYDGRTYPFRVIAIDPDSARVEVAPVK